MLCPICGRNNRQLYCTGCRRKISFEMVQVMPLDAPHRFAEPAVKPERVRPAAGSEHVPSPATEESPLNALRKTGMSAVRRLGAQLARVVRGPDGKRRGREKRHVEMRDL